MESIYRRYMNPPCQLCGDDHAMLAFKVVDGRNLREFNCPVTPHESRLKIMRESPAREYDVCPRKFAEACHFHPETVGRKIELFKERGEGTRLSAIAVDRLQQEVLKFCDEVRSSWTFTREVRGTSAEAEADDYEAGEEDSEDSPIPSKKSRSL